MAIKWTRRRMLGSALAGAASGRGGHARVAAAKTLNVLATACTRTRLTTGVAGDLTQAVARRATTPTSPGRRSTPIRCRTGCSARPASTGPTSASAILVNSRATPNVAPLLQAARRLPSEGADRGLRRHRAGPRRGHDHRRQADRRPVPHATIGLFYNEALLEERGIKAPPTTLEELVDQAKKLTFRSAAGTPVVGMVLASDLGGVPGDRSRAPYGGDFIGPGLQARAGPGGDGKGARHAARACTRRARCRAATPPRRTTTR